MRLQSLGYVYVLTLPSAVQRVSEYPDKVVDTMPEVVAFSMRRQDDREVDAICGREEPFRRAMIAVCSLPTRETASTQVAERRLAMTPELRLRGNFQANLTPIYPLPRARAVDD